MNEPSPHATQPLRSPAEPRAKSPEFKEGFLAVAVVFLVTFIANQRWSSAIVAALSTLVVIAPFYPLLRAVILKRPPVRIAVILIGLLVIGSYVSSYENSKKYEFTYRVGSVGYDGTRSDATGSGAQSSHGGVDYWLTESTLLERTEKERRKHSFGVVAFGLSMGCLLLVAGLMPNLFGIKLL